MQIFPIMPILTNHYYRYAHYRPMSMFMSMNNKQQTNESINFMNQSYLKVLSLDSKVFKYLHLYLIFIFKV